VLALLFAAGIGLEGARLVLCLVSAFVAYEAYLLGRRIHSPRVGRTAAWTVALFPPLVWYSRVLTSETLAAALVGAWCVLGLAYVQEGGGGRRTFALFALGGAMTLVRAELVVLAPLPFLVRAASRPLLREWARALGACLAVAMALAPWWLYNDRRFGEFIPLSTGGGVGLWIASHDPPITEFDAPEFQEASKRITVPGRPKRTDSLYAAEGRERINRDPLLYLARRVANLPRFWLGSHSEAVPGGEPAVGEALRERNRRALAIKGVGFGSQALLAAAALVGGLVSIRQGGPLFLWMVVAFKFAAHAPFVQAPRFSLHLAPVLCAYAAIAFVLAAHRARGRTPDAAAQPSEGGTSHPVTS
jgi:hypothetical protein